MFARYGDTRGLRQLEASPCRRRRADKNFQVQATAALPSDLRTRTQLDVPVAEAVHCRLPRFCDEQSGLGGAARLCGIARPGAKKRGSPIRAGGLLASAAEFSYIVQR